MRISRLYKDSFGYFMLLIKINKFLHRAMREWGAARLTMLAIRANVEEASMETGAFDDSVDEGLFPVIPGLRPIYNSLDHLAETVGQCSGYENAFKDYKLFFQQVPATIMDYNILKFDLESKLFECNVEVKVDKTELWSVQGITLLEGVTLVLFVSLSKVKFNKIFNIYNSTTFVLF